MRPGVPWNVKGIEAEAREVAQQAARRAGVSLGEYLSGLILTDGRGAPGGGYPQPQQQGYVPGDGTYGPQLQPQFQPQFRPQAVAPSAPQAVAARYPQAAAPAYPEPHHAPQAFGPAAALAAAYAPQPQAYPQGVPSANEYVARQPEPQRPYPQPGYAPAEPAYRAPEHDAFSASLRELGDRVEQSEHRAQQAIQTVNQSVASMQERLDAAERVKQLADAAFSSAADALAQSARDQSKAFESLETSVRNVQQRLTDIEEGQAEWPGRESLGRLEVALGHLQKRLGDLDADRDSLPSRDTVQRLETSVQQLQKRLSDMEVVAGNSPDKAALARLEATISSMRNEAMDADRRTRDDMTHMAKYMRDLGVRVEAAERVTVSAEGLGARFDALEARSTSMFDDIRGQMSAMDARIAQATSPSNTISPAAFAALKGSVEGIATRLDEMGTTTNQPLVQSISAIESKLGALTGKIEESDQRTLESVGSVNAVLRSLTNRFEDSDKRQAQAINAITRRMDESDQRAEAGVREINESFERVIDDFGQRLEAADKANKNSISAVRLTVDGLVSRAAEQAVRLDPRSAQVESALEAVRGASRQASPASGLPPFVTSQAGTHDRTFPSDLPPFLDDLPVNDGPVRGRGAEEDADFSTPGVPPLADLPQDPGPTGPAISVIEQARRAAQAAARANEDKPSPRRAGPATMAASAQAEGGRSVVRRAIIGLAVTAVVVGLVLIFYTMFPGGEEASQTGEGSWKVDETINPPADVDAVKVPGGAAEAPAAVAPPVDGMPADPAATPDAAFAPVPGSPEGAGVDGAPVTEQPSDFISGTSALPERSKKETEVAILEAASARGEARAQFLLSLRYAEGRGVPKDEGLSASLVSKAADQGLAVAQYRLGMLHERGVGIEKSVPKAKLWYEKAAKLGNRKAMHNLAVLLADTTGGSQNYREASRWFREGATYGLTDSQYNLAVLLEQGMGVEKNLKEAITWYAVAAEQGDTGAAERLEALKKSVPPADVGRALDAARKFKPRPLNPTVNELPALP
jgi:localization factor PodJL